MFRTSARVNRAHLFSVAVNRQTSGYHPRKDAELHISLPAESEVVISLLTYQATNFQSDDLRKEQPAAPTSVGDIRISHPGQNLRGLIERFGSFWTAEKFCERRVWREALEKLAGQDARKSETQTTTLRNKITKSLRKIGGIASAGEKAERIVRAIMPEVKGALADTPMTYPEFAELLKTGAQSESRHEEVSYLSGDSIVHLHNLRPLSETDLKGGLDQLIARNILRIGSELRCPNCGIRSWFHVDTLTQFNECFGCGNPLPITAHVEWSYRLNSLVKRCVSAHVLAVLQSLAILAHAFPASFFYSPSIDVFRPDSDEIWHEIDVVSVSNGSLVLGEVKDGKFDEGELNSFTEAVELIRPDRAAIFIRADQLDEKTQKWFSSFESQLAAIGVRAEIHQLLVM